MEYIDFVKEETEKLKSSNYKSQAISMQEKVSSMILQKQKSTVAIALSMSKNPDLAKEIISNNISSKYYLNLIGEFRENTLYQNIWIQILDSNATSLYRSWTDKKGDSLLTIRKDLEEVIEHKKVIFSISVGKFDLSIKAIVPIIKNEKFIGIIEVISHFNSISKQLSESNIYSLVLLKKEYKKQLEFPFTNLFIDDYYVANLDAPKVLMDYLQARKIEEYFNDSYKVENGYIIASYGLRNNNSEPLGYFVMFKKIKDLSSMDLDFFMFKWFAISIIIILSIIMIVVALLFYANTKQKKYYKNIIDTASNIVILNDGKTILDVNKAFFKYFIQYKTLEEFKKEHTCICDYFIEENEYLKKDMNGQSWVLYLVENKNKNIKVGMNFYGKIQYFFINASLVSEEKHHYSIVLSDITKEENYKNKLEHLSITDALTGIGNRRQFNQKIKDETVRANRYSNELSVIMFDIDFFKQVNDRHGHNIGDNVLVEYTLLISSMLRENDVFCRTGGEEFVIILPHVNKEDTRKIAEKIRKKVQESRIIVPITISMGVVEYIHGEDIEFVLKRVDDALYEAKNRGRNKVVVG